MTIKYLSHGALLFGLALLSPFAIAASHNAA